MSLQFFQQIWLCVRFDVRHFSVQCCEHVNILMRIDSGGQDGFDLSFVSLLTSFKQSNKLMAAESQQGRQT